MRQKLTVRRLFFGWLALGAAVAGTCLAQQAREPEPPPPEEHHGHRPATGHHDFSDAERWSGVFDDENRDGWQKPETVVALMAVRPGMTVVDLGAGTGYFLSHLAAAVGRDGRVLALDPEPNMVRFMTERCAREGLSNVKPRRIPFDDPDLGAESVDRILIVDTWHHIEDRGEYARKLLAALKPEGRVYVVDFTRDSPSGPPPWERPEPEEVMRELEAGGLLAELIVEELPRQYVVVGRRQRQGL